MADEDPMVAQLYALNDAIQDYANEHAPELPEALLKLLDELDLILNGV
jgi:hypothetical protein